MSAKAKDSKANFKVVDEAMDSAVAWVKYSKAYDPKPGVFKLIKEDGQWMVTYNRQREKGPFYDMHDNLNDNNLVHNTTIPDTALTALEIFTSIIQGKIEAYTTFGSNETDLKELNDILKMTIKDMVILSKQISDEISDEDVVEFVSYYNRLISE